MTFHIQKGWLRKGYELVRKGPETVQVSASIYGKLLENFSTERLHILRKGSEFVMLWKVFGKNFWFGQKRSSSQESYFWHSPTHNRGSC